MAGLPGFNLELDVSVQIQHGKERQGNKRPYSHPGSQAVRCTSPQRLGLSKPHTGFPLGSPKPGCLQHRNSRNTDTEKPAHAGFSTETPVCPSGNCSAGHPVAALLTHQHHSMVRLLQLSHRDVPAHGDIAIVGAALRTRSLRERVDHILPRSNRSNKRHYVQTTAGPRSTLTGGRCPHSSRP